MDRERGIVKTIVAAKRFGFIDRPAPPGQAKPQDVFFLFGAYPQGQVPSIGDELEFETVVEAGKKGPKATDISIVAKVLQNNQASVPTPSTELGKMKTAGEKPPETLDVIVEFLYDEKELVASADIFELPVVVRVSTPNGQRLRRANMALWVNGQQYTTPAGSKWYTTDHNGEVSLAIGFQRGYNETTDELGPPLNIHRIYLDALVSDGSKQLMRSEFVPRSTELKAQVVEKPIIPATQLEIKQGKRIVGKQVTFIAKTESGPGKGQIRVEVSKGFTKLVNLNAQTEVTAASSPVVWETNDSGILNVMIVTKECHHHVKGSLVNDSAKTSETEVYSA